MIWTWDLKSLFMIPWLWYHVKFDEIKYYHVPERNQSKSIVHDIFSLSHLNLQTYHIIIIYLTFHWTSYFVNNLVILNCWRHMHPLQIVPQTYPNHYLNFTKALITHTPTPNWGMQWWMPGTSILTMLVQEQSLWKVVTAGRDKYKFEYTTPGELQQNERNEKKIALLNKKVWAILNGEKFSPFL